MTHLMVSSRASALLVILGLLGCRGPEFPVPVAGRLSAIAGRWEGSYGGRESGRSGSIVFNLTPGRDTAIGDVLMVPRDFEIPPRPVASEQELHRVAASQAEAISIAFVTADSGGVVGQLAPYRDPDCGCHLDTRFIGRFVTRDRLEGTFISIHRETGHQTRGWWWAERRRTKPR